MKKRIRKQLIYLLLTLTFIMGFPMTAFADDAKTIRLKKENKSVNSPFDVVNMFPGDAETKEFVVKVSHKKPITLYYHADIQLGSEKLAEVMMVKIELPEKGILLYDGLMRDMPSALEHVLEANESEIVYRITAYLETSVGNDYQYKSLKADFRWWYSKEVEETEESTEESSEETMESTEETTEEVEETTTKPSKPEDSDGADTGDETNILLYIVLCVTSIAIMYVLLLFMIKQKEKEENKKK